MFVAAASGLDWEECRTLLEERIPGVVAQSIKDADTFFGVELPAVVEWDVRARAGCRHRRPVLSVIGAETQPLWVEIAEFLRSSLPHVEECTIDGVGHLLQIQRPEPVARTNGGVPGAILHRRQRTRSVRAAVRQPQCGRGSR